jgi:hypothetical protein
MCKAKVRFAFLRRLKEKTIEFESAVNQARGEAKSQAEKSVPVWRSPQ